MGHVRTSANFYRRGVPNAVHSFGALALANLIVPQPTSLFLKGYNTNYFNSAFRNVLSYR
jgi:hypothetical protein